jgi:hypothetical protein
MRIVFSQLVLPNRLAVMILALVLLILSVAFGWQQIVSSGERVIGLDSRIVSAESESLTGASGKGGGSYYMNPATAMTSDRPTVFFFIPSEVCQSQYCPPPWRVEALIQERYSGQVNFIIVEVRSLPYDGEPEAYPMLPYANWNLYPVAPFTELLPELSLTDYGLGLESSTVRLVDRDGQLVYEAGAAFSAESFMVSLSRLISEKS